MTRRGRHRARGRVPAAVACGLKDDPSRNDPNSPALTIIGLAIWTGPHPANLAATGKIGLMGTATSGYERISLTNVVVDPQ